MDKKSSVGIIVVLLNLCFLTPLFAEAVYLKSGKVAQGKIIEVTKEYVKMDISGVDITFFKDEIEEVDPRTEISDLDIEKTQVLHFFKKDNSILKNMESEATKRIALIAQAKAVGNEQEAQRLASEIRDLIAQQKQDYEAIFTPQICEELKSIKLRWMQLQEEEYDELSKGNSEQARSLALEVARHYNKMVEETNRILQHYGIS